MSVDGKHGGWWRTLRIIIPVIAIIALLTPLVVTVLRDGVDAVLPESRPLAALMIVLICCVKSVFTFIPFLPIFIVTGALFPVGWAIVLVYAAMAIELALGYFIGFALGKGKVLDMLRGRPKLKPMLSAYEKSASTACFLGRMLPFPFDPLSWFFGASGMPFWRHMVLSLLGVIPNSIPFVIAGRAIEDPLSSAFLVPFLVSLAISAMMFLLMRRLEKRGFLASDTEDRPENAPEASDREHEGMDASP
ncbi:VTT domain-containing protein [Eubacteriales bacterium OttesenSCG-928-A19]|nr:VTT domain-containing protein [Eubacteriales bacterium OttesenSCG-928-A19]